MKNRYSAPCVYSVERLGDRRLGVCLSACKCCADECIIRRICNTRFRKIYCAY